MNKEIFNLEDLKPKILEIQKTILFQKLHAMTMKRNLLFVLFEQ